MTGAAGQAAALFGLSGLLALIGVATDQGDRPMLLFAVGAADLLAAVLALLLPWDRYRDRVTVVVALVAFAILGVSTWAFEGFASGTGPFFVLAFVWLGLHARREVIAALVPVAALAYAVPLVLSEVRPRVIGSTVVLLPIASAVGFVIADRVRELEEARRAIEREERWRAALMASLAHDVRTPLTVLRGALDFVSADTDVPERHRRLFASMQRQVTRLTRLAGTLLDVERVQAGSLQLQRQWLDLETALRAILELPGASAIALEVPAGTKVWADPERLDQMLANLVGNALRHGRPPVRIRARQEEAATVVEVSDEGPGVPAGLQDRLFERFGADHGDGPDQGVADAAGATRSVGLGLWSTRLLAEAHGGDVTYRPGETGSVFSLTLPHPDTGRQARVSRPGGRSSAIP